MSREKEDKVNLDLACEAVLDRASEHNLVVLLDKWSSAGSNVVALEPLDRTLMKKYSTLGFYGHGGVFGISKASEMKRARMAVNHFLRERFPSKTWTSIAVLYNPSMPLHRDILNMIGHANHAVALGNILEGRVWIEDENGQSNDCARNKKMDRSCFMERGSTCMMLQLRSMLGNITCWKSIAETCGLLRHIRFKRSACSDLFWSRMLRKLKSFWSHMLRGCVPDSVFTSFPI